MVKLSMRKEEREAFRQFFKKEICAILSPVNKYFTKEMKCVTDLDVIKGCFDIFYLVNELTKFHENEKIEIISGSVLKLLTVVIAKECPLENEAILLIVDSKEVIEQDGWSDTISSRIENSVSGLEKYIFKLESEDQKLKVESKAGKLDKKKLTNGVIEHKAVADIEEQSMAEDVLENSKCFPINQPLSLTHDNLKNNNILHFNLPGEEDEDLMNLIQDAGKSMPISSSNINNFSQLNDVQQSRIENNVTNDLKLLQDADPDSYKKFYTEANLFINIILSTISQLKNVGETGTSLLEDIELASASLKYLAKRCGVQKLTFLPELIESICKNAKDTGLKIPPSILDQIEKGVQLLADFDTDSTEHEKQIMEILSALTNYYEYTLTELG